MNIKTIKLIRIIAFFLSRDFPLYYIDSSAALILCGGEHYAIQIQGVRHNCEVLPQISSALSLNMDIATA